MTAWTTEDHSWEKSGMIKNSLTTKWGRTWTEENRHTEYPRPQMVRDSYYCLNGEWDYAICAKAEVSSYEGMIHVPFSPETALSGVERTVMPEDYLHYRKKLRLPDSFYEPGQRVLLHFGAVDQECEVFWNGIRLGEHRGGYLPFTFDVTAHLLQENELRLTIRDFTEQSPHARGKQKLVRKGHMASIFYTPSSGIWKTVWMETVPQIYIRDVKLTPEFDSGCVKVELEIAGEGVKERPEEIKCLEKCQKKNVSGEKADYLVMKSEILVSFQGNPLKTVLTDLTSEEKKGATGYLVYRIRLPEQEIHPWTPDRPDLYDMELTYGTDCIRTYFGMRKFHRAKDNNGIWRFYLNNRPFFFNGVLDQGYWPESLLTPPTDEALAYDIKLLKSYGFNTIRKHVKIESDRFYYHCDRMGMIVWQDMPNGGGDYNMFFVTYLPNGFPKFGRIVKDSHYTLFRRTDRQGRMQYDADLKGMVQMLYNHPSIAAWVPFNEGWGQFDAGKATARIQSEDHTRLVNEACGWFDQGGGDMYSIHNYLRRLKVHPQRDRVTALTEFGGYAYPVPGHILCEKEFGYKAYQSVEELMESFAKLYETEIIPNIRNGLCGAIYTQTSDIEEEINGFVTYDREVEKFDAKRIQEVNAKVMREFERCVGMERG